MPKQTLPKQFSLPFKQFVLPQTIGSRANPLALPRKRETSIEHAGRYLVALVRLRTGAHPDERVHDREQA